MRAETLPTGPTSSPSRHATTPPASPAGYAIGELIGRGGMGEVVVATDEKFGRPVAIKRLRGRISPSAIQRFEREARIQARLEHPSIVPIYELGREADGRPYFTMKRLAGVTLAEVLAGRRTPMCRRQELLRAFADVCRAIDLAHTRGVIHRDLKPSNIMLGDFGEVYVLDWGVAGIAGEDDPSVSRRNLTDLGAMTTDSAVLGTPGYMAPEQARGEPITTAADSYALGCILSEILGDAELPELDELCSEAFAEDPEQRPSARELAARVERYLDGDRDLERRRVLAAEHLAHARAELERGERSAAMKAVGRAIALDPELAPAVDLASALILEPPAVLPAECDHHLAGVDAAFSRKLWGQVALAFLAFFAFIPMVAWEGVTDPWLTGAIFAVPAVMAVAAFYFHRGGRPRDYLYLIASSIGMMLVSRLFGILVVLPSLLAIQLVGYVAYPPFMRRPWVPIATILATLAIPLVLELVGVLESTWEVVGDTVVVRSSVLALGGAVTPVLLISIHAVSVLVLGWFAWTLASARRNAQRAVEIQAWHLRKLLA